MQKGEKPSGKGKKSNYKMKIKVQIEKGYKRLNRNWKKVNEA